VGPYLLPDRLTAQRCRDILDTVVSELFEDVSLAETQSLWFQQEGTPAQYGENARQWLKVTDPGRYIGFHGPIA
jgi:hypothetical protein